jgi:hypothetical protein
MIKQVGETCGLEVKMKNCGNVCTVQGFPFIIFMETKLESMETRLRWLTQVTDNITVWTTEVQA